MSALEKWQKLAARENARARENWDIAPPKVPPKKSRTRDGLVPLLGSGMTMVEAARIIGVTPPMVGKILRNEGWKL